MRVAISGAASGIGAETVKQLKTAGHEVLAFDIAEPAGVDQWIPTDLSSRQSIESALGHAEGNFDALINNAGLPPRDGLESTILSVNYFGVHDMMMGMRDKLNPGASIVNTASKAGAHWQENLAEVKALRALHRDDLDAFVHERNMNATRAYCLSKEAVVVLTMACTEALLAQQVRVNSVSPAAVSTGILEDFAAAFGDRMARNLARVGRPGSPAEIASVIVFLASADSSWINGQDITIDGGMTAAAMTEKLSLSPVSETAN